MSAVVSFCYLHFKTIHLNCRDNALCLGSEELTRPKYSIINDSLLPLSNLCMREHIKLVQFRQNLI